MPYTLQQLQQQLLRPLPNDGTVAGNISFLAQFQDMRAELDVDLLPQFESAVSLPFEADSNATVAVKVVDDRGVESLKVMRLQAGE